MSTVKTHKISAGFERHVRKIRAMLAEGDGHFLIGGVFKPEGLQPVIFTRNVSDEFRENLSRATVPVVKDLLVKYFAENSQGTTQ